MDLKNINLRDPKVFTPLIIVLIGIGAFILWYQQFYVPTTTTISTLQKTYKAKQDELNTIQALKPQLNILRAELKASQIKLDSLKSIFPDQKEIPKLIKEITSVAVTSGIYTTKFNPLPDVTRDYYMENRYSITVTGGYHQLAAFFSSLANFSLIINLTGVVIIQNPTFMDDADQYIEQGLALPSIVASFELTTFSSKR